MPAPLCTVDEMVGWIKHYHGNISAIAEHFGVRRSTIYNKINAKKTLIQAKHDEREAWKDIGEQGFYEALKARERWAIALVLAMSPERGWVLPKNGGFAEGESGQINSVTVNNISIQGVEHNRFADSDTQSIEITAIAAPSPEPEEESDTLTIEGEFTEAESDDAGS